MDFAPVNPPKHSNRWDRVVRCETNGVKNASPFKPVLIQYCDNRNDVWSRGVAMSCYGVHDLTAAEEQYHLRCYDEFRKIPACADKTLMIDDSTIKCWLMRCILNESYALGHPLNYMISM